MIKKLNVFLTFILILSLAFSIVMHVYAGYGGNNSKIIDNKVKKEISLKLKNNTNLNLKYKHTKVIPQLQSSTMNTYINKNNDEFYINNDNKKIKAINFKAKKLKNKLIYSVSELKRIAQKTIEDYVEIEDYDFDTYTYNKENSRYTFIWSKYINKIKTCDFIELDIESNGNVVSMITPYLGLYNKNDESKIEMTKNYISDNAAKDILDKVIKTKYYNIDKSTLENYLIKEEKLNFIQNGKLVWQYFVEINYNDKGNDFSFGEYFTINAISGELESIK